MTGAAAVAAVLVAVGLTALFVPHNIAPLGNVQASRQLTIVRGLDHVPIAVRNLAEAAETYRRMGFTLKPGTVHVNGIQNLHAKFPDGTELELITASEPRDDLSGTYVSHLEAGDGPAFAAFFAPDLVALGAHLAAVGRPHRAEGAVVSLPEPDPLSYVFFARRNRSPTDRPEHFEHPNTAVRLEAIWLSGVDLSAERELLESLGGTVTRRDVAVPRVTRATVVRLPEGEVRLLPVADERVRGRRIVGVTLIVRDAATAAIFLSGSSDALAIPVETPGGISVFAPPTSTHGLWLEFHEPGSRRSELD